MEKKNLILIVIIIVLLLVIVSGIILYIFVLNKPKEVVPKVKEIEIPKNTVEISFDSFVNNVKDSKKISKITIKIEVDKSLESLIENRKSEIISEINASLRNRTEEDYQGTEGQIKIQEDVKNIIKDTIQTQKDIKVYIIEIIVQ